MSDPEEGIVRGVESALQDLDGLRIMIWRVACDADGAVEQLFHRSDLLVEIVDVKADADGSEDDDDCGYLVQVSVFGLGGVTSLSCGIPA